MSKQTREKSSKPAAAKKPRQATRSTKVATPGSAAKSATKPAIAAKTVAAQGLAEGDVAPAFELARDGGSTATLAKLSGRKLVIFFYPRANTPGCTREAIDFTRLKPKFAACDTEVIGVSADSVKAQDSFRDKHALAIPLLSDPAHDMLAAYGAWGEKTLYGRKFEGIIRSTVLIGRDGRVVRIWRNVKVDGHADQVLAAAQAA